MFLMWIAPLLLVGLAVYALSGNHFADVFRPAAGRACPHCQKPAQISWNACPHCGQAL